MSYRQGTDVNETIKAKGTQDTAKIYSALNFYWNDSASSNSDGLKVTDDWFVSLTAPDATAETAYTLGDSLRNSDGSINLNGFMQLSETGIAALEAAGIEAEDVVATLDGDYAKITEVSQISGSTSEDTPSTGGESSTGSGSSGNTSSETTTSGGSSDTTSSDTTSSDTTSSTTTTSSSSTAASSSSAFEEDDTEEEAAVAGASRQTPSSSHGKNNGNKDVAKADTEEKADNADNADNAASSASTEEQKTEDQASVDASAESSVDNSASEASSEVTIIDEEER